MAPPLAPRRRPQPLPRCPKFSPFASWLWLQGRGFGKTTLSTPSAAFQYLYLAGKNGAAPYAECHRLSADVASHPGNETWSLVEPGNPSRGVQVRYEGGDLCCANGMSACSDPQPRSLELQFFCKDDTANVFDRETVLEYGKCHYKIWLDTASGCPTREHSGRRPAAATLTLAKRE